MKCFQHTESLHALSRSSKIDGEMEIVVNSVIDFVSGLLRRQYKDVDDSMHFAGRKQLRRDVVNTAVCLSSEEHFERASNQ